MNGAAYRVKNLFLLSVSSKSDNIWALDVLHQDYLYRLHPDIAIIRAGTSNWVMRALVFLVLSIFTVLPGLLEIGIDPEHFVVGSN